MAVIAEMAVNVVARTEALTKGLKRASNELVSFGKHVKRAAALTAVTAGVTWVTKLAMDMEKTEARFTTLIGSLGDAKAHMADLDKFSDQTPFAVEAWHDASASLIGFGVSVDDVLPKLQFLGDAASGSEMGLEALVDIFGRVATQGHLTTASLTRLVDGGVNIIPALGKHLNVLDSDVAKLVSEGKVSFADFEAAMQSMSQKGGIYFGAMSEESKTLAAKMEKLKGTFKEVGRMLGEMLKPILVAIVKILERVVKWWDSLHEKQQKNLVTLGLMVATFVIVLKYYKLFATAIKMISGLQAIQNTIMACGQALAGNWKAVIAAGVAAAAVGAGMYALLQKQNEEESKLLAEEEKRQKALDKALERQKLLTDEQKKQSKEAEKTRKALESRAASIAESVLTPLEEATKEVTELNFLVAQGFLSQETAAKKRRQIEERLLKETKPKQKEIERERAIGAATFRSAAGFSAAREGKRVQEQIRKLAERQLQEQQRQTDLLESLDENIALEPGVGNIHSVGA